MIKVEECKKTLCSKGKKFTDEEVKLIREQLYKLGGIVVETKTKQDEGLG